MFTKVEVELTSHCNAACPGCLRTQILEKGQLLPLNHLDEKILFQRFEKLKPEGSIIFLCGVLGDPLMHPKILEIINWFLSKGSQIEIFTNASLRSEKFYYELGEISFHTKRLALNFAVDGLEDTNSIYRVNTSYKMIKRNMMAYSRAKGLGVWVFIEFDHNLHQKEEARQQAYSLNLGFSVSRNTRNEVNQWQTKEKKSVISHHKGLPHPQIENYKKILSDRMENWDSSSINCLFTHQNRFFLASNGTVWPCCYLWDEYVRKRSPFYKMIDRTFPNNQWNSIYKHDFDLIFQNDFYQNLSHLWEEKNKKFTKRCYLSCGAKGGLRNSFTEE